MKQRILELIKILSTCCNLQRPTTDGAQQEWVNGCGCNKSKNGRPVHHLLKIKVLFETKEYVEYWTKIWIGTQIRCNRNHTFSKDTYASLHWMKRMFQNRLLVLLRMEACLHF